MSTSIVDNVTYVGDIAFEDAHEPVPGKSEWGLDTISRTMRGGQPNLVTFMEGLSQGDTYTFNSNVFYLQTWEPDNHPVFPSVSMMYKGLVGGIPSPTADGQTIEMNLTLTVNSPQDASRDIKYTTRQATTRYITTAVPTTPSYGLDADVAPVIISSVIRTGDGGLYYGNAPDGLVTALTPVGVVDRVVLRCHPVVGSPFYECSDVATRFLPGND